MPFSYRRLVLRGTAGQCKTAVITRGGERQEIEMTLEQIGPKQKEWRAAARQRHQLEAQILQASAELEMSVGRAAAEAYGTSSHRRSAVQNKQSFELPVSKSTFEMLRSASAHEVVQATNERLKAAGRQPIAVPLDQQQHTLRVRLPREVCLTGDE